LRIQDFAKIRDGEPATELERDWPDLVRLVNLVAVVEPDCLSEQGRGPSVSLGGSSFVGPYRLLYLIRTGRFTQVWAAIDDANQRRYALKILLPEYANDAEQRRAMEHEVEIGRKLDHRRLLGPHTLLDTRQGRSVLMELVPGRSLRELMTDCWKDMAVWMPDIVGQMTEALVQLHALGLMHLDVKPDNYLLDDQMSVCLIDFGLSRRLPGRWERWFWKQRQRVIQGTRSYIAPEQIRRVPLDLRVDIYGLGCSLYHLTTNTPPFTAASGNELLQKHLYEPPPNPCKINSDITPAAGRLIRSMMAKRPADRPESVATVLAELKVVKLLESQVEGPKSKRAVPAASRGIPVASRTESADRAGPAAKPAAVARVPDAQSA
jgi:serine/threonine protein kinase